MSGLATSIDDSVRVIDGVTLEAERRLVWMRLATTVTGTAVFPLVADPHNPVRWIAYALLAMGWVQTLLALLSERVLRASARRSVRVSTAIEAVFTLVWVHATGGVDSPWFVAIYASIIWVSLHRKPLDTVIAAGGCAAGYLLIAILQGQMAGRGVEIAIRIQYMVVVAVGSAIIARERMRRLTSRLGLLHLTQEVGQIGTWEWTFDEQTVTWSDELYKIFGVPRSHQPSLESFLAAVVPDDRERVASAIERARVDGQSFRLDHRVVTAAGVERTVHCRGRVVLDRDGKPREMVGSTQDISERRDMEAKLHTASKLVSLGTIASGVAHEINNPLAYVANNLELIDRQLGLLAAGRPDDQTKPLRDALTAARQGSARIREIVQGLKTFSRADNEDRRPVNLAHVVDLAIEIASHELTHRARIVRSFEPAPLVPANESRLTQVFMNLLVNAAQAIEHGTVADNEIRARIYRGDDGSACVDISDTGSGVSPENLPRIFDPFFTTKAVGVGTGLGLSICHGIVRELEGDIRVATTGPSGTTFRVSLPAAPVSSTTAAAEPLAAPTKTPVPRALPVRRHVCVVDDEARYAESLRLLLGVDHDVTLADTAARALELFANGPRFDVIFCDLMMPGKTGIDLYEEPGAENVRERIVFITGGATSERARQFLARPDIRYVEKPVEADELRALIDEISARPALP